MKISIQDIEINGFGSFDWNQKLKLTPNTLYGIFGINEDTGSSNASGKTTFLNSIIVGIFGLKGIRLTSKDITNRILDKKPNIKITINAGSDKLFIDRTIGGNINASLNGNPIVGKNEDIQNIINSTVKVTPEQFSNLAFKNQGETNSFLLMKDSEKKDFLSSFFDLSKIDFIQETNGELLKQAASTFISLNAKYEQVKENFNNVNEMHKKKSDDLDCLLLKYEYIEDLGKANITDSAKLLSIDSCFAADMVSITQLEEDSANLANQLSSKNNSTLQKQVESIDLQLKNLEEQDFESVSSTEKLQIQTLNHSIITLENSLNQNKIKIPGHQNNYSNNENQIKAFHDVTIKKQLSISSISETGLCTECGQIINKADQAAKINQLNSEIESNLRSIEDLKLKNAQLKISTDELMNLTQTHQNDLVKLKETKVLIESDFITKRDQFYNSKSEQKDFLASAKNNLLNAVVELHNKYKLTQSSLELMKKDVEMRKSQFTSTIIQKIDNRTNEIKLYTNNLNILKTDLNQLDIALSKYENTKNETHNAITECDQKIAIYKEIEKISSRNGFIGYVFDSILNKINELTNITLKGMTVVSNVSIFFKSDKSNKSNANINKSINCIIFKDGQEISLDSLSGGEKLSLILAVDEAVEDVLSARIGVSIGFKILDEQMSYVDENNKANILEWIQQKAQNRTYLIVDHASELNASIENRIVIKKQNGLSRFIQ